MRQADADSQQNLELLVRPRLIRSLQARFSHRLFKIVAGPGFGKSVLLRQVIAENLMDSRGRDVWLPLSDLGKEAELVERAAVRLLVAHGSESVSLGEAVLAAAPVRVCLIFDDAHLFDSTDFINDLLTRLPSNGHVLVAAHHLHHLRDARLMAKGDVATLGEADLAFTPDEVDLLAARHEADEPIESAGGWPAHVSLQLRVGREVASRYVWEEVLSLLSEAERLAVAKWALIGRASKELLDEVVGPDWHALAASLPLLDEDANGRRLHDLWGQNLAGELSEAEQAATLSRAANHLAGLDPDRAIALWQQAQAWRELLNYFRDLGLGLSLRPNSDVLRAALKALPEELQQGPEATLAAGIEDWSHVPAHSPTLFERAAQQFRDRDDARGEAAALMRLNDHAQLGRRLDVQREIRARIEKLAERGDDWLADLVNLLLALELRNENKPEAGLDALGRIQAGTENWLLEPTAGVLRSTFLLQLGQLAEAETAALETLAISRGSFRALPYANMIWAIWFQGRREEARLRVDEAITSLGIADPNQSTWMATGLCYSAFIYLMTGKVDVAIELLDGAEPLIGETVGQRPTYATIRALVMLEHGRDAEAAHLLKNTWIDEDSLGDTPRRVPAPWHMLVPACRSELDRLEGCYATGVELAGALLAGRNGDLDSLRVLDLPAPQIVGAFLPPRLTCELALHLVTVGRSDDAARLVDDLGTATRRHLGTFDNEWHTSAESQLRPRLAPRPFTRWRMESLGPMRLITDDSEADLAHWRRGRVRELASFLVEYPYPTRARVMTAIWHHFDDRKARRNLEVTLSYLTALLDGGRQPGEAAYFVRSTGDRIGISVDGDALHIDVIEFEAALAAARTSETDGVPSQAIPHYLRALDLYRGQYLTGLKAEWVVRPRDRKQSAFVQAASRAAELLLAGGDAIQSVAVAERAVDANPYHERGHQALIEALVVLGDTVGASTAADAVFDYLAELEVQPSASLSATMRRLSITPSRLSTG